MASKRIDELTTRTVADTDLLPVTPPGGPSGSATVAAIVAEGLSQPNSASSGAGASITIKAADGVTSGAGGSIILEPGAQATTGGNGAVVIRLPGASGTKQSCLQIQSENATDCRFTAGDNLTGASFFFTRGANTTAARTEVWISYQSGGQNCSLYAQNFTGNDNASFNLSVSQGMIFGGNNIGVRWAPGAHYNTSDCGMYRGGIGIIRVNNGSTGGGSLAYTSSTPAAITASQNDYVLTGSAFQRLNCTTASDITGIAPPTGGAHVDGRMIRIVSVGTATVTLKHNNTSSTAANRMYMSGAADKALAVNAWADLVYDSTDNGSGAAGWRVM